MQENNKLEHDRTSTEGEKRIVKVVGAGLGATARRRNELMTAKFRLSLQAHRLFLYVLSQVRDGHDQDTEYEFSVNELANAIGIDRGHLYKSMVAVLDELAGTMVTVPALQDGKPVPERLLRVGLIKNRQSVKIGGGGQSLLDGAIAVSLYKELLPYVLELKERYAETELKYVFRLTSSYSQKLYDLLKTWAFTGRPWRVGRDELMALLAVEKGKFGLFGDFRRFVLERAQREISQHTDLAFDIDYVSSGRTVTELIFRLRKEGGQEVEVLPGTPQHTVFKGLIDLGLKAKAAEAVLQDWWDEDPERVRWHLAEARRQLANGKIKNAVGWFLTGIRKDYRPQRSLLAGLHRQAAETRRTYAREGGIDLGEPALKQALDQLYSDVGRHAA